MDIHIESLESIDAAAQAFIESIGDARVVAFHAPMGMGKTTFISAVCRQLGVPAEEISSPTFAIVNEYVAEPSGERVYHFDCYRLESIEEALDMGVEDYLYSGDLCLIEWPEVIEPLLPDDTLYVSLSH